MADAVVLSSERERRFRRFRRDVEIAEGDARQAAVPLLRGTARRFGDEDLAHGSGGGEKYALLSQVFGPLTSRR